ncbi:MAG: fatty acid desaturase [Steroidobacteraceae bacterium]|jgi:fatty acid desaturase
MQGIFRRDDGALPNLAVILYTLIGWAAGIWLLTLPALWLNALGVVLTAHTLIYSAYLIHDCSHHAVFRGAAANDRLGLVMSWINGACLASYVGLKKKHLRHHSDRLDVVTFDYRAALNGCPRWLRRVVIALEWAYVPAVELLMRGFVIAAPFASENRGSRARLVRVLAIRIAAFGALGFVSPRALLGYALAYWLFIMVLRFMDAFQHTYAVYATRSLAPAPVDARRDLRYEYENTYSNLIAERWPWLNVLVLNFPYHNAHHVRPSEPWYRLPALHRQLYGEQRDRQVIVCRELIASFHRHRVARIFAEDCGLVGAAGETPSGGAGGRAGEFIGAVGVSFLTAV